MFKKPAQKGQGVVEYAGALALAALIVGGVIAAAPTNLATMFTSMVTAVSAYLTGLL